VEANVINTRLQRMGNSVAVTLPREVLQASGLQYRDEVNVDVLEDGRVTVTKADTAYSRAMDAGRRSARRYSTALAILAR
jgi:antitoxin component of MazEF toxin-antitoxin module